MNDNQLFYSSQGVAHLIETTLDTFKDRFVQHVDDLMTNAVVFLVCSPLLFLLISMFFKQHARKPAFIISTSCKNKRLFSTYHLYLSYI